MIAPLILLYLVFTMLIGVISAHLIKSTKDYIQAGRRLPFSVATFVAFATWFGSETVLGASSEMAKSGLGGVVQDPFGASLCLILVGLFFAKPLYKMNILTLGDFFRIKYNSKVELISSIMMVLSYFGWIAAQMLALGIVLKMIFGIDKNSGIVLGSFIVLFYTFLGGMWAVAISDFIQSIMIIVGLIVVLFDISDGFTTILPVIKSQDLNFYTNFFPSLNINEILLFITSLITIGLGSIPQQDVFQRIMSAKSAKVAARSSVAAGFLYLFIALIPLILAIFSRVKYPQLLQNDYHFLLPTLIYNEANTFSKVMFFGAIVSAIMSTASSATLAPSIVLSENILKPLFFKKINDKQLMWLTRLCVIFITLVSLFFAVNGRSIFSLVASAASISLVSLFIPFVFGVFLIKSYHVSAVLSMFFGFATWIVFEFLFSFKFSLIVGLFSSLLFYCMPLIIQSNFNIFKKIMFVVLIQYRKAKKI